MMHFLSSATIHLHKTQTKFKLKKNLWPEGI